MTIPVWDEFGHKSGRLFHLSKYGQKNPDTQEDYASKDEDTAAIREIKVQQKERDLTSFNKTNQVKKETKTENNNNNKNYKAYQDEFSQGVNPNPNSNPKTAFF